MVRIGPLGDEQRRALLALRRRAVGRVSMRAHMVLLSARGYSVALIAEIFEVGEDVVRTWLHRFQQEGPDGLADRPRPGRPPTDRLARPIVDAQASNPPHCSGLVQACWTVGLLAAFLAARFRVVLSPSSVRRHLKAMGWRWGRPRLAPASVLRKRRDPDREAKLAAIAAALRLVATGAAALLYLDECDLHLLPVVRTMWMKGPRVRVPTPGQSGRHAFFGALDAASGVFHWMDRERKLAIHFVGFLECLAATYPDGPLFVVLDGAPCHTAKVVQRWVAAHPRVHVLWLPKYAAHEANPVERIWGLMKDAVAANRLAGSLAELVAGARRFFAHDLPRHPVTLPHAA
jgi:transposase